MLVSIIIPVYNVAPYIEDCLRSVMRQTYTGPMECLIVDDCGTDESIPIAERMIAEYDGPIRFEILHHEHNRGLSAARNTGMDKAVGEYIYFIDSDDTITEDCLKLMMAVVEEYPEVELVQGSYIRDADGKKTKSPSEILTAHACSNDEIRRLNQLYVMAWNKLVKRSFLQDNKISFIEGLLYEDNPWTFYILKYVTNVYFLSESTYTHLKRPGSIMTGTDEITSAHHRSVLYQVYVNHLTPGYEKEELRHYGVSYYIQCLLYASCYPAMKDTFRLYQEKARELKDNLFNYYCYRGAFAYRLGQNIFGRILLSLLFRIKHPSRIPKDFARIWRWLKRKVKA